MPDRPARFRRWLGSLCQVAAWHLLDPHSNWAVEYPNDDGMYGKIIKGRYSQARAFCREHRGRVLGENAMCVEAYSDE